MRTLRFTFDAEATTIKPTRIGVVASGDLEILVDDDGTPGIATVRVRTSIDGFDSVWEQVLQRFFAQNRIGGRWELNDFGATPGVVSLRLRQAAQAALIGESN
ncbi:malonate decarboxylase acyl carrier protein [Mycobacteroides immunogenum]|uniref:malonate decarboxylase acyl carrier protein n=1 Tax=Mycobacteroides immunogenum TaxID=83262 RepID=UPI0025B76C3D|nr:malonate decarboxylase acyl carrier protein [Mycobacteroides immunogenum]WJR36128.1 malonate decarboxylase acyl carrier protein [Mycobacteroides immunogenum]